MNRTKVAISWILRVLLAFGFIMAGLGKLTGGERVLEMFQHWGFPDGFHVIIGILEVGLAVLILIPKTLQFALVGLTIIMIGAIITHIAKDPISNVLRPIIFFVFIASIYVINYYKIKRAQGD